MNKSEKTTSSNFYAIAIILWQSLFTAISIYLSLSGIWYLWLIGQLFMAINLFQWFVIHHDLAHGGFFKTKVFNVLVGHLSSLFCLMPFFSWKQVHHNHHKWTGWKDKDPSDPLSQIKEVKPMTVKLMNFCWKYWIPVFSISFVVINFWNLNRVNTLYPDRKSKLKNLFSIAFLAMVYIALMTIFFKQMLVCWLPAFLIFLFISDPILLTQHVHIDANFANGQNVKSFRFSEQSMYARTIIYPKFISKYFFYNSERHGLHHKHPEIPIYQLGKLSSPVENNIYWLDWLKIAKKMPANILIFKTSTDSGIKL